MHRPPSVSCPRLHAAFPIHADVRNSDDVITLEVRRMLGACTPSERFDSQCYKFNFHPIHIYLCLFFGSYCENTLMVLGCAEHPHQRLLERLHSVMEFMLTCAISMTSSLSIGRSYRRQHTYYGFCAVQCRQR